MSAGAAKLTQSGPGSRLLGAAGRDNVTNASSRGGFGSVSGRATRSTGGSRGAGCSVHGSRHGSVHGEGLSNHPMHAQHGSCAALMLLDAGASQQTAVSV